LVIKRLAKRLRGRGRCPGAAGLPGRDPGCREHHRRLRGGRPHPDHPVREQAKPRTIRVTSSDTKHAVTA